MPLTHDRYREAILAHAALLSGHVRAADPAAPVPTCPEWSVGRLARHVGGTHRWAAEAVGTRAAGPVPDDLVNDVDRWPDADAATLAGWLAEGAERLAGALADAGPDAPVWTPGPGGTAAFWARRMTFETVLHRYDAARAKGVAYALEADLAGDGLDEWMEFAAVPEAYEPDAGKPDLLGAGRTLHFHATDAPGAEWLVDLTGAAPVWRRAHEKAAVAVRGPVTELLLLVYGRPAEGVEVLGDAELLDVWLARSRFWLW
jgi:uncharacterized protein (TIGR03083 family)